MASAHIGVVLDPEAFENAKVDIDTYKDGHIAAVRLLDAREVSLTIHASGDGARTMAEGLRLLADRIEAARTEWLREAKAERDAEQGPVGEQSFDDEWKSHPIIGIHGSENGQPKQPTGVLDCIRPDRHGPDDHGPSCCWDSEPKAAG